MKSSTYRLLFSLTIFLVTVSVSWKLWGGQIKRYTKEGIFNTRQSVHAFFNTDGSLPSVEHNSNDAGTALPVSSYELDESQRIGLGVFLPEAGGTEYESVLEFEKLVGHKMEYILVYQDWGNTDNDFPSEDIPYFKSLELTPIITWEPWLRDHSNSTQVQPQFTLGTIVEGKHDKYIEMWAKEAKKAEIPIILRFAHEMSTSVGYRVWYPWQGEPEMYVSAYQRIVRIFQTVGADNVKFMWNPIVFNVGGGIFTNPDLYYPGDRYVDYIGFTIINFGVIPRRGEHYWKSCDYLLGNQYKATVNHPGKPIIVAELLSSEIGGSKAQWYTRCMSSLKQNPSVIGVLSFQTDEDYNLSTPSEVDWRVNSSPESLEAFKKATETGYK